MQQTDTIAAIATPLGNGGVGIIRISGPEAISALSRLFKPLKPMEQMESHRLYFGSIISPDDGVLLDQGLAVLMRGPHSFTGEDVAEMQLHGGMCLLRHVLAAALAAGCRLAEPGEFSLRAFLNGRLDLVQAEAVPDLIAAGSRRALNLAATQLSGSFSARIAVLEAEITAILAAITVGVDFPDDADAPEAAALLPQVLSLLEETEALLKTAESGRLYREGLHAALAGAVNVGKSSLLNRLLDADRAIVTDQPGTTRDLIEETVDLDGLPLVLCDTAGFRSEAVDQAEKLGMERSQAALERADLILLVLDASRPLDAESLRLLAATRERKRLILLNKCDIASAEAIAALHEALLTEAPLELSAKTGQGLNALHAAILHIAGADTAPEPALPMVSNIRHQQALLRGREHLAQAVAALMQGLPADIAGIDLENAALAMGEISGKTVSEEVLKEIFSRFCLGK